MKMWMVNEVSQEVDLLHWPATATSGGSEIKESAYDAEAQV